MVEGEACLVHSSQATGQRASVRIVAWRHDPDPAKLKAGAGLENLNTFRTACAAVWQSCPSPVKIS